MPGLVGIITKRGGEWAVPQLKKMIAALQHEPSYVSGLWSDEAAGVYAGWTARKNSFSDGMPLYNEQRNKVLLFSGEEYPDPQSIAQLREHGHRFDAGGPEYLVHFSEEDAQFPRGLNGRFHGLLVDRAIGTVSLFNDRYGMSRVYYHESRDAVYFAAEAKAILAVMPQLRRADERALGEFIACGCVLEDRTLFQDIHVLPTASAWKFRNGALDKKERYFDASEWERQEPLEQERYYQQLKETFAAILPRYMNGREPVGISLTGGLDTRMIMAWSKAAPHSLQSYTFGGPYRDCQDVVIARKIAGLCQQPYQVIPVGDEFLSRFAHYAERAVYLSDGCAAVNRGADLYANEIAAQIAPVRLTGNYGSEILRRLRAFKPSDPASGLFQPSLMAFVDLAKQTYQSLFGNHAVSFTAFRQAPWYQYGLLSLEQTQLSIRSPFLDNHLVRVAFRAPSAELVKSDIFEDNDDCSRLIADGNPELHQIPTDRGLGGANQWTAPIKRGLLEFTFKAEYAYDYGMPQWMARIDHALSWFQLERLFLGRHKFCHYRVWYRGILAKYVRETLLDSHRPYVQRNHLEEMVSRHLKGDRNYTTEITRLLTLELQHRLFLDAI